MNFQNLPKDVKRELALNLSPKDLINLCLTDKITNKEICNSNEFWTRKLQKDYPEELYEFYMDNIPIKNAKKSYINRFQYISKEFEDFIDDFIVEMFNIKFLDYLNKTYKEDLYKTIYIIYQEVLEEALLDEEEIEELVSSYGIGENFLFDGYGLTGAEPDKSITRFINNLIFKDKINTARRKAVKKMMLK